MVVTIEDEGPGVPAEAREAIFNRFHSMRPEQDFGRHSGLGLAIARAIVEGHGGRIEVEDRIARSADFTLPEAPGGVSWRLLIDTNLRDEVTEADLPFGTAYEVTGRSLLLLALTV